MSRMVERKAVRTYYKTGEEEGEEEENMKRRTERAWKEWEVSKGNTIVLNFFRQSLVY